jgi:amino acid transporter
MTTALIVWTAIGAILFVLVYALAAPFYRTEEGWNVMAFMVVVSAMVAQAFYVRRTGHRLPEWVARVDWALAGLCIWWRLTIVVRGQWSNMRGRSRHRRNNQRVSGVPGVPPETGKRF